MFVDVVESEKSHHDAFEFYPLEVCGDGHAGTVYRPVGESDSKHLSFFIDEVNDFRRWIFDRHSQAGCCIRKTKGEHQFSRVNWGHSQGTFAFFLGHGRCRIIPLCENFPHAKIGGPYSLDGRKEYEIAMIFSLLLVLIAMNFFFVIVFFGEGASALEAGNLSWCALNIAMLAVNGGVGTSVLSKVLK